jgi:hypothetical protein
MPIPNRFKCGITFEIMDDPVTTICNHTFERAPLFHYFDMIQANLNYILDNPVDDLLNVALLPFQGVPHDHVQCPNCRQHANRATTRTNDALRNEITAARAANPNLDNERDQEEVDEENRQNLRKLAIERAERAAAKAKLEKEKQTAQAAAAKPAAPPPALVLGHGFWAPNAAVPQVAAPQIAPQAPLAHQFEEDDEVAPPMPAFVDQLLPPMPNAEAPWAFIDDQEDFIQHFQHLGLADNAVNNQAIDNGLNTLQEDLEIAQVNLNNFIQARQNIAANAILAIQAPQVRANAQEQYEQNLEIARQDLVHVAENAINAILDAGPDAAILIQNGRDAIEQALANGRELVLNALQNVQNLGQAENVLQHAAHQLFAHQEAAQREAAARLEAERVRAAQAAQAAHDAEVARLTAEANEAAFRRNEAAEQERLRNAALERLRRG